MNNHKDYVMKVLWLDDAQPAIMTACARDLIEAHSEMWQKLPRNRYDQVDTFETQAILLCAHTKATKQ